MAEIQIKHNIEEVIKSLDATQKRQVPYALAMALNKTAQRIEAYQVANMRAIFDRPTPYALRGLYVRRATKTNWMATVETRWPERLAEKSHFLEPHIFGGARELKAFERRLKDKGILPSGMMTVPGNDAAMDSYGNMSRGQLVKILSYFEAFSEAGYAANATAEGKAKLKRGTKKRAGTEYFVLKERRGNMLPGIYQRFYLAFGAAIKCLLIFVNASATYNQRWAFFDLGRQRANQWLGYDFRESLDEAMTDGK